MNTAQPTNFCLGKIAYGTARAARDAVHDHRRFLRDFTIEAYACPSCHMWHLGHPDAFGRRWSDSVAPGVETFADILRRHTQQAVDRMTTGPHKMFSREDAARKISLVLGISLVQRDIVRCLTPVQCVDVLEMFEAIAEARETHRAEERRLNKHSRQQSRRYRIQRRVAGERGAA